MVGAAPAARAPLGRDHFILRARAWAGAAAEPPLFRDLLWRDRALFVCLLSRGKGDALPSAAS